jgi:hypothetical protein
MKESVEKHNVHEYTRKKRKLLTTPRKTRGNKDITEKRKGCWDEEVVRDGSFQIYIVSTLNGDFSAQLPSFRPRAAKNLLCS